MITQNFFLKDINSNDTPKYIKIVNAFKESINVNAFKPSMQQKPV